MTARPLLVLLACAVAGCSSTSGSSVTRDSIVTLPYGYNLLQNPHFRVHPRATWTVRVPARSDLVVSDVRDLHVLTISHRPPGASGPLFIEQRPLLLPQTSVGTTYVLRVRLRARKLSRPVKTEIRLTYSGGGYAFFAAAPLSPPGASGDIRGTTDGWVSVEARATAALPIASIEVLLLDSLPRPRFSGSISVADPSLFVARGSRSSS
jgi:hypothetical protein